MNESPRKEPYFGPNSNPRPQPIRPDLYCIVMHYDPHTAPDFIHRIFQRAFSIDREASIHFLAHAKAAGKTSFLLLSRDVATTRWANATAMVQQGHPNVDFLGTSCRLQFSIEPVQQPRR